MVSRAGRGNGVRSDFDSEMVLVFEVEDGEDR
jgi:hypothetical protein